MRFTMNFIKENKLAILTAIFVGLVYVAPNIIFILSLGNGYRGIPIMQTSNEDFYLARIQEILDGHPSLGSPAFFEYKNQMPLSPPVGEFLYALPGLIFGVSPVFTLIASRFFLPALLFLLIYYLIRQLTGNDNIFANKINAVAGALFVTLGYDMVDYRTFFNYLKGISAPGNFLIWTRPVNPILGAVFLFSFLLCVWQIVQKNKKVKTFIFFASLFLALMMASYFFSWSIAVSIIGILILIYLLLKEFRTAVNLFFIVLFGFLFAAPYWYVTWRASQSLWYQESVLRSGIFYTRYPLLNKFLLATLAFYVFLLAFDFFWNKKNQIAYRFHHWHWFCLAFILGGLWAYSQQIVTGRTVWPYHFVQYSIPLAIIVVMTLLFNVRKSISYSWHVFIILIILVSLSLGIYVQASTYRQFYSYYAGLQSQATLFDWLNQRDKDCVVLIANEPADSYILNGLILSFTRCNTYDSNWVFSLMPDDRILHNYLAHLFFNGVTPETIQDYLKNHSPRSYLFSNWKGLYGSPDFPDFRDPKLEKRIRELPENYGEFIKKDIREELGKYRLDYILSFGELESNLVQSMKLSKIYAANGIIIYSFIK